MSRFEKSGTADESARPNWYEALEREPGRMNKEPTLAQMQKIKEESMMENTYGKTTNKGKMAKGKMAVGAIVAAGAIFGGVWGANSAGWLDGTPDAAQTQAVASNQTPSGQTNPGNGQNGANAGGPAAGGLSDEEKSAQATDEMKASMQAQDIAEKFKKADLEVSKSQREDYEASMQGDESKLEDWIADRYGQLAPYADEKFLASYMMNRIGMLPYEAAVNTDSELTISDLKMTTNSVDLEKKLVRIDYTLNLEFSSGRDPLALEGAIWVQEGQDGWKVMKDVPEKASFRELYNLATPNTPMGG
ncbi:hypothetical protein CDO73_00620 [Saccharibacillus sp. O23]|uniref:hypothetical protein n=1 Tax=Saccharibacillus sp. O23 TaxID=2009338 RepID=UPI000B4E5AB7|nr:hypothetical protein [Saccharibacillus sp. O23]OWR33045.1 hypothetical protein CDO73_00620 [Saccharibacillus sp. O23]